MWFPIAVLRVRAKLFQCQHVGIDLPFTSNYSSCGDGCWSPLYHGDTRGMSPPCAFTCRGFTPSWSMMLLKPGAPSPFPSKGQGDARGCRQGLLALVV